MRHIDRFLMKAARRFRSRELVQSLPTPLLSVPYTHSVEKPRVLKTRFESNRSSSRQFSSDLRIYCHLEENESCNDQIPSLNYHEILGIPTNATKDRIRSAYHTRLFETHPDHGGSAEQFRLVREAYEALVFPDDLVLRQFSDCIWANDTKKAEMLWKTLVPRMHQTQTLRFDSLYFDAILYACNSDEHYLQLTWMVHEAAREHLFVDDASKEVAYDSLLWHLQEGNRLGKCDVHLLFDCLDYMHTNKLPVLKDGWYSMHYWQG
eukprot:CAMPEP_0184491096 /NCGR_PEP_ID=MMETSP0113_2-20130426/19597_1 /TAXON_ID=91329 /ORGANISM="Norrisiella sphaerica, Strain BC52" /LENGTH=263 /DNA_ID=CAMNT_0026875305 /DNA_START=46 /DNA_END=837 /DNA_ORIENTATION=-